jgi:allantoicase
VTGGSDASLATQSMFWRQLLPEQKLEADRLHVFTREVMDMGAVTHFRINVIPDGGVNRLRMFGALV